MLHAAKWFLERQRNASAFRTFYASVVREAKDLAEDPKLQDRNRLNDGASNHHQKTTLDNNILNLLTCFLLNFQNISIYLFNSTGN